MAWETTGFEVQYLDFEKYQCMIIYWHHNYSPLCSQRSLGIAWFDCSSGTQRALQTDQVFALSADLTGWPLKMHSWLPRFKKVTSKLKLPGLHQREPQSFRLLVFQNVSTIVTQKRTWALMMPHDAWWAISVASSRSSRSSQGGLVPSVRWANGGNMKWTHTQWKWKFPKIVVPPNHPL